MRDLWLYVSVGAIVVAFLVYSYKAVEWALHQIAFEINWRPDSDDADDERGHK